MGKDVQRMAMLYVIIRDFVREICRERVGHELQDNARISRKCCCITWVSRASGEVVVFADGCKRSMAEVVSACIARWRDLIDGFVLYFRAVRLTLGDVPAQCAIRVTIAALRRGVLTISRAWGPRCFDLIVVWSEIHAIALNSQTSLVVTWGFTDWALRDVVALGHDPYMIVYASIWSWNAISQVGLYPTSGGRMVISMFILWRARRWIV